MYGPSPQILSGGTTRGLADMRAILDSAEWKDLKEQLLTFVDNYQQKVIKARGGFQL